MPCLTPRCSKTRVEIKRHTNALTTDGRDQVHHALPDDDAAQNVCRVVVALSHLDRSVDVLCQKRADELRNFRSILFQSEVSGVEQMQFRAGRILQERLRARRGKYWIVLTPAYSPRSSRIRCMVSLASPVDAFFVRSGVSERLFCSALDKERLR
jgi:hypothetical protein